jgi:peptidoglycan/LPS O-acetylase OafA/YrhL
VLMKHIDSDNRTVDVLIPFLSPLLYASILALCLEVRAGGAASAVLTNPFFRAVAQYSYAIYLFHLASGRLVFKAYVRIDAWFPAIHKLFTLIFIPVVFAVVFGLAAISWRFIEGPALSLKDRFFRAEKQAPRQSVRGRVLENDLLHRSS